MKALIIGATGATGQDLVSVLLQDPHYTEVVAFVRRSSGRLHPKLTEILTDFDHLEKVADSIRGDVWFTCLGTTRSAAGSQEKQWHIDYEIPARFAEIARQNGVPKAVVLSAYGAASTSKVFYSRMKGTSPRSASNSASSSGPDFCCARRPIGPASASPPGS
jgi:nucleoside-diphosphate-sugar epimerase